MNVVQRCCIHTVHGNRIVSMPHAALYVVQLSLESPCLWRACFNAARSIVCGATCCRFWRMCFVREFQCRTQHCMWCNPGDGRRLRLQADVSMPHAALYVVQLFSRSVVAKAMVGFNAARSIVCGATPSLTALVPRRARGHFGKSSIFYRFSLIGRHFHRKTTALIGAFPCAARSCAQMENGDGRMRLCGIAVAFSTFLHLLYHI